MAAYISYQKYTQMGGNAEEATFRRLELKARKLIDAATHGRVSDETPVRESVEMCAFELAEMMYVAENETGIGGKEVASAGNDGVSIAYNAADNQDMTARQRKVIKDWLSAEYTQNGVNLLYCGVD